MLPGRWSSSTLVLSATVWGAALMLSYTTPALAFVAAASSVALRSVRQGARSARGARSSALYGLKRKAKVEVEENVSDEMVL